MAVLIMIEAHTLDSWTLMDERSRSDYRWAIVIGGFGAPTFLFLAGVALALAAGARLARGLSEGEVASRARRRAWEIFGLAFLFRLQSAVLGAGGIRSFLKVDILHVMGLSMLGTAVLWGLVRHSGWKALTLVIAATASAMLTPIVRESMVFAPLPDPLEAYIVPVMAYSGFTVLPWCGFVLAGAAIGLWLDSARTSSEERRVLMWFGLIGPVLAAVGYYASFLPTIYRESHFWTSSPTFFLVRTGILIAAIPIAYVGRSFVPGRSQIEKFGVASLFVYWVHVEMAYGFLTWPIRRRLTFEQALLAFAVFTVLLYGLVKLKDRIVSARERTVPARQ